MMLSPKHFKYKFLLDVPSKRKVGFDCIPPRPCPFPPPRPAVTHAAGLQSFSCNLLQVLSLKRHLPINPTEGCERRPNTDEDRWAARSAWECRSERLKVRPALITRRANQTPTRNKLNRNFLFSPPYPIQTNALLKHYML